LLDQGLLARPFAVVAGLEYLGAEIGPYTLLEELGEGGFGVVYRAEQRVPIRRMVALKILKPGLDTRQVVARFQAERQMLASLEHPNIAHVLDAGATPSGRPYFVMELVRGESLTAYCDRRRFGLRERLALFMDVCRAIHHAHQRGIVHRDLKPSNILVTERDGQPVAKVIDFGIAKARGELGFMDPAVTSWTAEGVPCPGTPVYMSPEQAARMAGLGARVVTAADGSVEPAIDHRCDVYSLGSMLYELLTGITPFDPALLRDLPQAELLRVVREEDPPRPSRRVASCDPVTRLERAAARGVDPEAWPGLLQRELDWVVLQAIEKDRTRRYASAADLAVDIERYLRGERVEACPASLTYRTSKTARRYRTQLTSVAIAALCLSGGLWMGWRRASSRIEEAATVTPRAAIASPSLPGAPPAETPMATSPTAVSPVETNYGDALIRAWRARDNGDLDGARAALTEAAAHAETLGAGRVGRPLPFSLRYLQSLVSAPVREFSAQQHPLMAASLSPDGQLVVTGDRNGQVNVWSVPEGKVVHSFRYMADAENMEVTAVAFSPDGSRLATGGKDQLIHVFSTQDWQERQVLRGHDATVRTLQWSPDGQMLISGAPDETVRIWDVDTAQELRQLPGVHGTVRCVGWSPDGRFVVAAVEREVRVWSTADWQERPPLQGAGDSVICLAFHPQQPWLAVGGYFDELLVFDIETSQLQSRVSSASIHWSLRFSPDGELLLAGGAAGGPSVWQVQAAGRQLQLLRGRLYHSGYQRAVLLPDDGRTLVTVSEQDQLIRVQGFAQALGWKSMRSEHEFVGVLPQAAESANARSSFHLIGVPATQVPELLDPVTGRLEPLEGVEKLDVGYARRGDLEVACLPGGVVRARSTRDQRVLWEHSGVEVPPYEMAISPDGAWVVGASSMFRSFSTVYLWRADTGELLREFRGHTRAAFSPDGRTLALLGINRRDVVLWDMASSRAVQQLASGLAELPCLAFTPDGQRVLAGTSTSTVLEWDVATGRLLRQLPGPRGRVTNLAIHPDGQSMVTTSSDWTSRLWHLPSGQEICTILQHRAAQHYPGEQYWIEFADLDTLVVASTKDESGYQTLYVLRATNE
jgi:WD40 repeat protein/serine/threonine protein kinase